MNPRRLTCLLALSVCLLSACATRTAAALEFPNIDELRDHAEESFDVSFGRFSLRAAAWLANDDSDGQELKHLLQGIKSVQIRHFEFKDGADYRQAKLERLRTSFLARGWTSLLQARDRRSHEDADVFLAVEDDRITGFALLAVDSGELTMVHVQGVIDPQQVGKLRATFGRAVEHTN